MISSSRWLWHAACSLEWNTTHNWNCIWFSDELRILNIFVVVVFSQSVKYIAGVYYIHYTCISIFWMKIPSIKSTQWVTFFELNLEIMWPNNNRNGKTTILNWIYLIFFSVINKLIGIGLLILRGPLFNKSRSYIQSNMADQLLTTTYFLIAVKEPHSRIPAE